MAKFTYAERVCKKVRKLLSHDERFKTIVECQPSVELDADFNLRGMHWSYYDLDIHVSEEQVVYYERSRAQAVLIRYNGFDHLLKL